MNFKILVELKFWTKSLKSSTIFLVDFFHRAFLFQSVGSDFPQVALHSNLEEAQNPIHFGFSSTMKIYFFSFGKSLFSISSICPYSNKEFAPISTQKFPEKLNFLPFWLLQFCSEVSRQVLWISSCKRSFFSQSLDAEMKAGANKIFYLFSFNLYFSQSDVQELLSISSTIKG